MDYSIVGIVPSYRFLKRLKQLFFPKDRVFSFKLKSDKKHYWMSELNGDVSLMVTALSEFTTKDEEI